MAEYRNFRDDELDLNWGMFVKEGLYTSLSDTVKAMGGTAVTSTSSLYTVTATGWTGQVGWILTKLSANTSLISFYTVGLQSTAASPDVVNLVPASALPAEWSRLIGTVQTTDIVSSATPAVFLSKYDSTGVSVDFTINGSVPTGDAINFGRVLILTTV